jgi:hypothetical protein
MTGAPKHSVPIKMNCVFNRITPAHMRATLSTNNEAPTRLSGTIS